MVWENLENIIIEYRHLREEEIFPSWDKNDNKKRAMEILNIFVPVGEKILNLENKKIIARIEKREIKSRWYETLLLIFVPGYLTGCIRNDPTTGNNFSEIELIKKEEEKRKIEDRLKQEINNYNLVKFLEEREIKGILEARKKLTEKEIKLINLYNPEVKFLEDSILYRNCIYIKLKEGF